MDRRRLRAASCYNNLMPARLAFLLPHRPVRLFQLEPDKSYLIGRGPECDPRFGDPRLSRRHAEVTRQGDGWRIRDLGSKNGILVDGRRVEESKLRPGAWLSVGGVLGRFEEVTEEVVESERQAAHTLRETTRELARQLDPSMGLERLLNKVLESVLALTALERGFVLMTDEGGNLRLAAHRSVSEVDLVAEEFAGSWGAVGLALEKREIVVEADLTASVGLADRPSILGQGIRALACVPMEAGNRLTGLVYADTTDSGREFSQLDIELLDSLCGQAAIALGVARVSHRIGSIRGQLESAMGDSVRLNALLHSRLPEYRRPVDDDDLVRTVLGGTNN